MLEIGECALKSGGALWQEPSGGRRDKRWLYSELFQGRKNYSDFPAVLSVSQAAWCEQWPGTMSTW